MYNILQLVRCFYTNKLFTENVVLIKDFYVALLTCFGKNLTFDSKKDIFANRNNFLYRYQFYTQGNEERNWHLALFFLWTASWTYSGDLKLC